MVFGEFIEYTFQFLVDAVLHIINLFCLGVWTFRKMMSHQRPLSICTAWTICSDIWIKGTKSNRHIKKLHNEILKFCIFDRCYGSTTRWESGEARKFGAHGKNIAQILVLQLQEPISSSPHIRYTVWEPLQYVTCPLQMQSIQSCHRRAQNTDATVWKYEQNLSHVSPATVE
jgi:hypothetical protein